MIDTVDGLYDEMDEAAMNDPEYGRDDEAARESGRDQEWESADEVADAAERDLFRERYWKP